jgi:hypothetical protein
MEQGVFVREGQMQVGPGAKYFVFLDGDYLMNLLVEQSRFPKERDYTEVGRVHVTVERLEA